MQERDLGPYQLRQAIDAEDFQRLYILRGHCFTPKSPCDADAKDDICTHVMIENRCSGALVCCFRMLALAPSDLNLSYAAQFYDLSPLSRLQGKMLEIGRFCIDPAHSDPDILRLAWSALAAYVDRHDIRMLFGCTSFTGNLPDRYDEAFALLSAQFLAPPMWAPRSKAAEIHAFDQPCSKPPQRALALRQMPPLLRSYLNLGAKVSDHAVIDRALNTLHVFTGLQVEAIPETRKRLLRAI